MAADVKITWNGTAALDAEKSALARGLFRAAEFVLGEARLVVPIEDSILSGSGATSVDAEKLVAAVSFDTPYAVVQHERLDYRHDEGRTAKYLERPAVETRRKQGQIIAQTISGDLL